MRNPVESSPVTAAAGTYLHHSPSSSTSDLRVPLLNLSTVRSRMDSVQRFLRESVNTNTLIASDQMDMVSSEISSAIHQIIVNGAALLACSRSENPSLSVSGQFEGTASKYTEVGIPVASTSSIMNKSDGLKVSESDQKFDFGEPDDIDDKRIIDLKVEVQEVQEEDMNEDWDIVELDAVELLAEHIHFCDICGKGFKRDANLRMHMRAHGNQFKSPEALLKPEKFASSLKRTRFSCPYLGCNRNKSHKKFRPLKSVICVKNHFKRSHCPKLYSCDRCKNKCFSVMADLKSHLKHCGEAKWKCSCGTSFSRKDKLFGHMALFEGHMPAVMEDDEKARGINSTVEDEEDDEDRIVKDVELAQLGANFPENGFFEGLFEGFGSMENFDLQGLLDSPNGDLGSGMDWVL